MLNYSDKQQWKLANLVWNLVHQFDVTVHVSRGHLTQFLIELTVNLHLGLMAKLRRQIALSKNPSVQRVPGSSKRVKQGSYGYSGPIILFYTILFHWLKKHKKNTGIFNKCLHEIDRILVWLLDVICHDVNNVNKEKHLFRWTFKPDTAIFL